MEDVNDKKDRSHLKRRINMNTPNKNQPNKPQDSKKPQAPAPQQKPKGK